MGILQRFEIGTFKTIDHIWLPESIGSRRFPEFRKFNRWIRCLDDPAVAERVADDVVQVRRPRHGLGIVVLRCRRHLHRRPKWSLSGISALTLAAFALTLISALSRGRLLALPLALRIRPCRFIWRLLDLKLLRRVG